MTSYIIHGLFRNLVQEDALLSTASFPKQNTMKAMVVNGMFLISGRMKNIGHEL